MEFLTNPTDNTFFQAISKSPQQNDLSEGEFIAVPPRFTAKKPPHQRREFPKKFEKTKILLKARIFKKFKVFLTILSCNGLTRILLISAYSFTASQAPFLTKSLGNVFRRITPPFSTCQGLSVGLSRLLLFLIGLVCIELILS